LKKTKILITGTRTILDAGETALLFTTLDQLNKHIKNVEIVVGLTCDDADFRKTLPDYISTNLRIVKSFNAGVHPLRVLVLVLRCIPEYVNADLVLDISGDGFTDGAQYGLFSTLSHASQLLIGIFLRKRVIVCAQSIGPLKTRLTQLIGHFTLNKVNLITVREKITETYLQSLRVTKPPLYLTADLAFILDPAPVSLEPIDKKKLVGRPLIGVSISQVIHSWAFPYLRNETLQYDAYIESMQKIIDYTMEKYDADVVFILHTSGEKARHDDGIAAQKVLSKIKYKDRVKIVSNGCKPSEVKRAISGCDLFIASKMHTAVAATTMNVPTVPIAYNFKVYGIIGDMLKQGNLIVDIRTTKVEDFIKQMISNIDYAWENRQIIREVLKEQTQKARESALYNFELIRGFVESDT
jgi:polysaccharide pyruvyl transferase WcaK-like protein